MARLRALAALAPRAGRAVSTAPTTPTPSPPTPPSTLHLTTAVAVLTATGPGEVTNLTPESLVDQSAGRLARAWAVGALSDADGDALLAGGRGGCVRVWDARTGEALLGEGGWDVAAGCGRGGGGGGGAGRAVSGVAVHPTAPVVAAAVGGRVGGLEGGGEAGEEEGAAPPAWNGVSFWGVASAWTAL